MMTILFRGAALSLAALLPLVAACAGSPDGRIATAPPVAPSENHFLGREPVYAHLKRGSGGSWVFTTITDSDVQPDAGYLVRLNDLTPAFDTRMAECAPQTYPELHRCSITNPFRDKDSGVVDKIISSGLAVGTAGKVTDISSTYETSFDETAFNRAVDEALVNTGLDATRRKLIEDLENYRALQQRGRGEIADLERQANEARSSIATSYPHEIEPRVRGLSGYFKGDVDFSRVVELAPTDDNVAIAAGFEHRQILPCDVRSCVTDAESALVDLRETLEQRRSGLVRLISPTTLTFTVSCDPESVDEYVVEMSCPDEVVLTRNAVTVIPVELTILARDFVGLYPAFEIEDERLRIDIDGTRITFINPTPEYLTVTAQTLYYNALVETTSMSIAIAPGASVTYPIHEFSSPLMDVESTYRQMTPGKAEKASFDFGLAARYRIADGATEYTVFAQETFNVGCTIDNLLTPGSCQHEKAAGSDSPEDAAAKVGDSRGTSSRRSP